MDDNKELSYISKKRVAIEQSKKELQAVIEKKCSLEFKQIEQLNAKLVVLRELEHELKQGIEPVASSAKIHWKTKERLDKEAAGSAK